MAACAAMWASVASVAHRMTLSRTSRTRSNASAGARRLGRFRSTEWPSKMEQYCANLNGGAMSRGYLAFPWRVSECSARGGYARRCQI